MSRFEKSANRQPPHRRTVALPTVALPTVAPSTDAPPAEFSLRALHPFIGVLTTGLGTACAMAIIPNDPGPEGALFWPGLVLAIFLLIVPVWSTLRNFRSCLRAEHIVAAAPIFWLLLDILQGAYELSGANTWLVRHAFLAIGLFSVGVWSSALIKKSWCPRFIERAAGIDVPVHLYFTASIFCFAIAFFRFAYPSDFDIMAMIEGLGGGRWQAPWSRGQEGGWDAFIDHLSYFGYLLPLLTVVIARKSSWKDPRTIIVGVCAIIITLFLAQGGGRRIVGVMYGSALVYWFITQPKVRAWHIFVILAFSAVLIGGLQSMLKYRNVGVGAVLRDEIDAPLEDKDYIHVDDNFLRLCQTIAIIPGDHAHTSWQYVLWVLARPIPRVLWSGKPMDMGFDLPTYLGHEGVSYSMSVIGELFAAFGLVGIFVGGFIYGRYACVLTNILERFHQYPGGIIIYSAGTLALFAGVRSGIELVLMSYMILVWIVLSSFMRAADR